MKILQLCKKIPYPLRDGESVAIHYLSKGLVTEGCLVDLLAFNTKKHFVKYEALPAELSHYNNIQKVSLDTSIQPITALLNLFSSKSYNIQRFESDEFERALTDLLEKETYDIVQLETLYLAPYIPILKKYSNAKIVMRSHNIESEIWQNLSRQSSNFLKKFYFNLCSARLLDYELAVQDSYDSLLPISSEDEKKYRHNGYKNISCCIPIGLEMGKYASGQKLKSKNNLRLGNIGSLDWKPNIEGIDWFRSEVWWDLKEKYPTLEFHLAGRNPGDKYQSERLEGFKMHGEVEDALAFIGQLDIMVVPLFSGSGMRVKIIEAMASGILVLSTSKGFEGIPVQDGKTCFVFENSTELIEAVGICIEKPELVEEIRNNALRLIENNFDYQIIAKSLVGHYKQLISIE